MPGVAASYLAGEFGADLEATDVDGNIDGNAGQEGIPVEGDGLGAE